MQSSERLSRLTESQTLALTKKVRQLKAEGRDVVGLTLGEPDFDTPVHIRNAAIEAIRESFTHYPPVAGIPELREAAANKFSRDNGLDYKAENIVISTGAKQSLVNAMMALLNPGDEAILPAPYWVSYYEMLKLAEAEIKVLDTTVESRYKISPEQLEAAITPRTRMFLINSPSNPCGTMYTREEMEALAEVLRRHPQVLILSDEIYEHISYDAEHVSPGSLEGLQDRTITVNGLSKAFAMTGWRLGILGAPKWIAALCEKFQGQVTSGTCSITQRAAVEALNGDMKPTFEMRDAFRERRDRMFERLQAIEGVRVFEPEGAFYFYPDLSEFLGKTTPKGRKIDDIDQLCDWLIEDHGLALIPGTAFGTDSHVRISYAYNMQTLDKAMDRLEEGLNSLK